MIVNADDLAMTPGANKAIFDGFDNGAITHASIMANCDFFDEAIVEANKREGLGIGMHLNLTYGKALIQNPLYCNQNGVFKLGYKDLLLKRDNNFLNAIEKELEEQIIKVKNRLNRDITHLDSHRHIHLIPHIYKIVIKLAKKYNINRVRLIKESFTKSISLNKKFNFISNGGIIKYLLLKTFTTIDKKYCDLYKDINFYSILYTGVVDSDILYKLKDEKQNYEIMIHPSYVELDKDIDFYDLGEKKYRLSSDRTIELKSVLSLKKD